MKTHIEQHSKYKEEASKSFIKALKENNTKGIIEAFKNGVDVFYNNGEALSYVCIEKPLIYLCARIIDLTAYEDLFSWYENNSKTIKMLDEALEKSQNTITLIDSNGKEYTKDLSQGIIYINPFSQVTFQKYHDSEKKFLGPKGFCAGVSKFYALRELSARNSSKENNSTIDKLHSIYKTNSKDSLYRIHVLQKNQKDFEDLGGKFEFNNFNENKKALSEYIDQNLVVLFAYSTVGAGHSMLINKEKNEIYKFFDCNIGDIKIKTKNSLFEQIEVIMKNLYKMQTAPITYYSGSKSIEHLLNNENNNENYLKKKLDKYFLDKPSFHNFNNPLLKEKIIDIVKNYGDKNQGDCLDQNQMHQLVYLCIMKNFNDFAQILEPIFKNPNFDVNHESNEYSLLQEALIKNNIDIIKTLLENKANVMKQDKFGDTMLHYATQKIESLTEIIKLHNNLNIQNNKGNTVLHNIFKQLIYGLEYELDSTQYQGMIKLLIDNKADPSIKNNENKNIFDLIKESGISNEVNDIFEVNSLGNLGDDILN